MSKNTDFSTSSWDFLGEEMSKYIKDMTSTMENNVEKGLNEASEYLKKQLENNTPADSGELKKSWEITKKYKGVKYIYNTKLIPSKSEMIPLLNVIEFSTLHGKPFVRRTFDQNENQIKEIIIKNINKETNNE